MGGDLVLGVCIMYVMDWGGMTFVQLALKGTILGV